MPCSRSRRSLATQSARSEVTMPPSPVVSSLRGWKDQAAMSAPVPTGAPYALDPTAQAASSITGIPRGSSNAVRARMSAGTPPWCTAMTARVRGLITSATVSGTRLPVRASTSANTGSAPR